MTPVERGKRTESFTPNQYFKCSTRTRREVDEGIDRPSEPSHSFDFTSLRLISLLGGVPSSHIKSGKRV